MEGDLRYLAYCSNANWTVIPTRYGASAAEAAGPVHGQTKPMVTIGTVRLSTRAVTEEIRCTNCGANLFFSSAESDAKGLRMQSISRRNIATPQ